MNRENVGSYLWIIVTVLIMICLLAFASPFGVFVKNNVDKWTGNFVETPGPEPVTTELYTLKIIYDTADSEKELENIELHLKKYEQYNVPSPQINGYVPDIKTVEGAIVEDTVVKVKYSRGNYSITYVTNNGTWNDALLNADGKLISKYTSYDFGDEFNLPNASDITRDSKNFLGWYEDEACKGNKITEIKATDFGNKIFYAKWASNEYNITYVLNDANNEYYYCKNENIAGSIADWDSVVIDTNGNLKSEFTTYTHGKQFKLPTTLHKFGYTFVGWSEKPNGEDAVNNYRTQITENDTGDKVFYAHWKRNTYTITYHTDFTRPDGTNAAYLFASNLTYTITDSNGKTTTHQGYPKTYKYGDTIVLPTKLTLAGYDKSKPSDMFWYNQPTNIISIEPGTKNAGKVNGYPNDLVYKGKISPSTIGFIIGNTSTHPYDHTNLDLYVKPIPNTYKVTFHVNIDKDTTYAQTNQDIIEKNPTEVQTFLYDEYKQLISNPFNSIKGYTFLNWNTEPDGSGVTYTNEQAVKNLTTGTNVDLYAQWEKHKYYVEYDLNRGSSTTKPLYGPQTENGQPTEIQPSWYVGEVDFDELFNVVDPVKPGYVFDGWKIVEVSNPGVDENGKKKNYIFDENTALYKEGNASTFSKINDRFCQSLSKNPSIFVNLASKNNVYIKLKADWQPLPENGGPIKYILGLSHAKLGSLAPKKYKYDTDIHISHPSAVGYTFDGWIIDNLEVSNENDYNPIRHYYGTQKYQVANNLVKPNKNPIPLNETSYPVGKATHFINLRTSGLVIFKATWTANEYEIKYDPNDGAFESNSNPTKAKYDESFTVNDIPKRTGYTFKGWKITNMSNDCTHTYGNDTTTNTSIELTNAKTFKNLHSSNDGEVIFTAQWTPNEYDVKYIYNNGEDNKTITEKFDQTFSVTHPTRLGYTFNGWNIRNMDGCTHVYGNSTTTQTWLNNVKTTSFKNLRSDNEKTVTFTAQWTPNPYKITLNDNGGSGGDGYIYEIYDHYFQNRDKTKIITTVTKPKRANYTFDGYFANSNGTGTKYIDENGTIIVGPTTFTSNKTIYAHWTPKDYKITLNDNGGSGGDGYIYEIYDTNFKNGGKTKVITAVTKPKRANYIFDGYYANSDGTGTKYIDGNGKIIVGPTTFTSNKTIYAKWKPNPYKITLNDNGGSGGDGYIYEIYDHYFQNKNKTEVIITVTKPTKANYIFDGYFANSNGTGTKYIDENGTIIVGPTTFTSNKTIYARWTPKDYKITLNDNGGSGGDGYIYETYGTNFKNDDKTKVITNVTKPKRANYNFDGYYENNDGTGKQYINKYGKIIVGPTTFTSNKTIYAKWTPKDYEITLDNGDSGDDGYIYETYDTNFKNDDKTKVITNVAKPEKEGYDFHGYFENSDGTGKQYINKYGKIIVGPTTFTSNKTIYAKWTPIKRTIVLNKNHNDTSGFKTGNGSIYQIYDDKFYFDANCSQELKAITIPTRRGFTFDGYYMFNNGTGKKYFDKDGNPQLGSPTLVNDITIYAYWIPKDYKITLNDNGGSGGDGYIYEIYSKYFQNKNKTESIIAVTIPTKIGYTFEGYYTGTNGTGTKFTDKYGGIIVKPTVFTSNTTVYAHWTPNTYNISYKLNGGSATTKPTTAIYDTAFTVSNPTKTNYSFEGWDITGMSTTCTHTYGSKTTTNVTLASIKETTFKNLHSENGATVTFTAKWKAAHECDIITIKKQAGCISGGKNIKYCQIGGALCEYKPTYSSTTNALSHNNDPVGTCDTHHHIESCTNSTSYEHSDWGTWWTYDNQSGHYHPKCSHGQDITSGFTEMYCSRKTNFRDDYSVQGEIKGVYYCGYRDSSGCYIHGKFHDALVLFKCPGRGTEKHAKSYKSLISDSAKLKDNPLEVIPVHPTTPDSKGMCCKGNFAKNCKVAQNWDRTNLKFNN